MPFEAFPVHEIREGWMAGNNDEKAVAKQIADIYQEVETKGGEVVGDHDVGTDYAPSLHSRDRVVKFIVARFPNGEQSQT